MFDPSQAHIEADEPSTSADDSGIESDSDGSTLASLTDSIKEYEYENGRKYHKPQRSSYLFPTDQKECDRMDLALHIIQLGFDGKLWHAPIDPKTTQEILDLGCGSGGWCIGMGDEMAKLKSSAKIIGLDRSPHQPEIVPPNVEFQVADFEEEWTFKAKFDLIRVANMVGTTRNWEALIEKCFKHLKPGGWLEINGTTMVPDCDDETMKKDQDEYYKWTQDLCGAANKVGIDLDPRWDWQKKMQDAGFENTQEQQLYVPVGTWAKDKKLKYMGACWRVLLEDGLEAISQMLLTHILGRSQQEVDTQLAQVKKALEPKTCKKIHRYYTYNFTAGRKPMLLPEP